MTMNKRMEEFLTKYVHSTGYWYKDMAKNLHLNSEELSAWLVNYLSQYREELIYDLGCGTGYYLKELHKAGHKKLVGVEADPCVLHEEFPILPLNLTEPITGLSKGVVISLEVAEHIPQEYEEHFLDNLVSLCSKLIIMSWAVEGQPGVGHFNCRNNDYVINKLGEKGFRFLNEDTEDARRYPTGITGYFKNTLMIFERI